MLGMAAFGFAVPGPLREELTAAVLTGAKTATTSLAVDFAIDGSILPRVGDRSVIYDSELRPVAVIETTAWTLSTISQVGDELAWAEGEGYRDAAEWRVSHERYWNGFLDDYRRDLHDPDFSLTPSTAVVCEWFRLVEVLDPETGRPR